ncbi:MAG: Crp/Fnr family transcriptional regulator [Anaerolineaceae bacterium]|nr:Crp/Fnr family transcriptional regulator [Anaerolineaceae bacterium]
MIDLRNFEIFSSLSDQVMDQLMSQVIFRQFPKRSYIFLEGDESRYICLIQSGTVKIFKSTQDGREQILASMGKGVMFNLVPMMLAENPVHNANAQALTDIELILIPRSYFHSLLRNNSEFSFNIMKLLANRLQRITELSVNLGIRDVRSRLAGFLIKQADGYAATAMVTQDEIAAHIGSVRDVVGRILREFEVKGLIKKERHQVVLLDRQGLEDMAGIDRLK